MTKNLGASLGQAAPALTFCIPADSSSTDDKGDKWSRTINRKEGNYVVASAPAGANGLAYLPVKKGNAFERHRLQHFTSSPPQQRGPRAYPWWLTFVQRASQLADATTYMEVAFESEACAQTHPRRCSANR
jgi:hypothetical protein